MKIGTSVDLKYRLLVFRAADEDCVSSVTASYGQMTDIEAVEVIL